MVATPELLGLENDVDGARVVREELNLLAIVLRALEAATSSVNAAHQGRQDDDARMLELREEVATAKPEDLPALFEQMHHIGALRGQRGKGVAGAIDRASPYFGHLRLEENGKRRDVLVGGKSYVDSSAGIRIVDWRNAPVSRIFYRYMQDEDYEERLGDRTVEGVVLARRSVGIMKGELVRVAAPEGVFVRGADGVWKRVDAAVARLQTERAFAKSTGISTEASKKRLGIGADGHLRQDKHLPAIASLLDAAQFELIARPGAGLVAIQGSAGSGKTTVGLHRIAYLAFSDPKRFRPDNMMVVVTNDALVHYVDRVLPSLDVPGVAVTTFERWSKRTCSYMLPKVPTRVSDETPPVVSRAKAHSAMLRAIDDVVRSIDRECDEKLRLQMAKWPSGDLVVAAWEKTGQITKATPDARVTALAQWVAGKRQFTDVRASSELPEVTRGALERLGPELRSQTRSIIDVWDEVLTNRDRLRHVFEGEPGFGEGQIDQVHAWCVWQARIRQEGERDGEVATIDLEDPALLLRIWQTLRGPIVDVQERPMRFAHLFVDEVQDANPVALRVLIELTGQERCVTLAGDIAQRMFDDGDDRGEFDWHSLLTDLDVPHTKIEPLQVSYRSTAEITSFARRVLGPLAHESEPIATRHGPPVELFTFSSPGESVAFLADTLKELAQAEPYANVAIVARFAPQADLYADGLVRAEVPNVRRVAKQDFTWEPGVDVTDVRQTKGLEFDEVVLVETTASSYSTAPTARHAMYVGATRAAHQLWCIASGEPSPIVVDAIR